MDVIGERMASQTKASKIEKLTALPGVGAATAKKLVDAKLDTVSKVATAGASKLIKAGIKAAVAKKIASAAKSADKAASATKAVSTKAKAAAKKAPAKAKAAASKAKAAAKKATKAKATASKAKAAAKKAPAKAKEVASSAKNLAKSTKSEEREKRYIRIKENWTITKDATFEDVMVQEFQEVNYELFNNLLSKSSTCQEGSMDG